jgi:TrmH family RNA methyltransferase
MLSKSRTRYVRSLQQEKVRARLRLYVVEGDTMVRDYLEAGRPIEQLYVVDEWWETLPQCAKASVADVARVSRAELERLSSLPSPQSAIALVRQPEGELDPSRLAAGLTLALEAVRDPGNLGSLLRVAAWFGVTQVVCSPDCVDPYNPKVVQATMGAFLHVEVHSEALVPALQSAAANGVPIYGTVLNGEAIYDADLERSGVILLGNEARGLSEEVLPLVGRKLTIPPWTPSAPGKDSLNVAVAAAVVCSEFRRQERLRSGRG